jgi:hypothetical protein
MDKIISTKEINKTLKQGIVTPEILGYAAYSVNKRAKNWRDKESEYRDIRRHNRYWNDKYDNEGKAREKKEEYYDYKESICKMFKPSKVHSFTEWKWDRDLQEEYPVEKYFLYYEFGGFSFHQPVDDVENLKLPVEQLDDDFETFGADIHGLMSMQMVNKIMNGINNGQYKLQVA